MSGFQHWALIYGSEDDFADHVVPFIQEGIDADAAILAALDDGKTALLKERLGDAAAAVQFADIRELGRNPGTIISVWQDWVNANAGRQLYGIGEPAWPGRSALEFDECRQHECLLNAAFADVGDFKLVCPYDGRALETSVLARVSDSHLTMVTAGGVHASDTFIGPEAMSVLLAERLTDVPAVVAGMTFQVETLRDVRHSTRAFATDAGFEGDAIDDFVLAVNELAENSVNHGPGRGRLRIWLEGDSLVAEVDDAGRLADPLVGRRRPKGDGRGGYGLWLAHQVCDLVQVRSSESGTTVRAYLRLPAANAA